MNGSASPRHYASASEFRGGSMAEIESFDTAALFASMTTDPVLSNVELPLRRVYYPSGFALEVTTNSDAVLAGAQDSWGQFRQAFPEGPLQLRVGVMGMGKEVCPPTPTCRACVCAIPRGSRSGRCRRW